MRTTLALGLMALSAACGGDSADKEPDAQTTDRDGGGRRDADTADSGVGAEMDAGRDAEVDNLDANLFPPEAAIGDASGRDGDDASVLDAGDHDSGTQDAQVPDTGTVDAGGEDASVHCDDQDPSTEDAYDARFGCGVRHGPTWVRFPLEGQAFLDVDYLFNRVWSPYANGGFNVTRPALIEHCTTLELGGLTEFRVPSIDDVRTLADGCATTKVGGSCPLSEEAACTAEACGTGTPACASCTGGEGPYLNGYYCRAELPDCGFIWTSTDCADCDTPKNWQYVASNGFFAARDVSATPGRCVADLHAAD